MQLIDTHTHIYGEEFDQDREDVVERALDAGVTTMLLPAIDSTTHQRQEALANQYTDHFKQMMGLHPTSVKEDYKQELSICKELLFSNPDKYVGIGEIGLDFYWDRTFEKEQEEVLREQLQWANELHKPVALHIRDSYERVLEILSEKEFQGMKGIFHCFSGTLDQAQEAVSKGFLLGIGGVVTFKKSTLVEVVQQIPLQQIVLETDSPYLAPVPHRGKRNESSYVCHVAQKIAEIKMISLEEVAEQTTMNAKLLFQL